MSTLMMYAMASLVITVIPGPTMLLALTNGLTKNSSVIGLGIAGAIFSDLLLIGLVAVGLGSLLAASEILFSVVKWIGVGYLFWLALQLWRSPSGLSLSGTKRAPQLSGSQAFMRSLLVALSNPKGVLFFSAFLPQFIIIDEPQLRQYVAFALVTATIDIVIMLCYAFGGLQAARLLTAAGLRNINRFCAAFMLLLAGGLAVYKKL
ncbi:LysE family translocator [Yersinia massiliensis]|uniref:LysE family translocator n=1 Tax=Yersinia massiliensis TaxID=419257 RepID=UPI001CFD009D|nr:LysE family transporter [Yersinia massiliensis]MCB5309696.1 LysE family transporter [Yersinia massiliensis]